MKSGYSYRECKELGICITCGKPASVGARCLTCDKKNRVSCLNRYHEKKKNKLCARCSKKISAGTYCQKCKDKRKRKVKLKGSFPVFDAIQEERQ
jgi:hypothetical protein